MKNLTKTTLACAIGLMFLFAQFNAFSATNPTDKTIEKARAAVEAAGPDDWETLAKSAEMCIRKNVNMTEAKQWIDASMEIKESPLALEVAGDYYKANKLYTKATDHYVKSMLALKKSDFYADTSHLEAKIDKVKKLRS